MRWARMGKMCCSSMSWWIVRCWMKERERAIRREEGSGVVVVGSVAEEEGGETAV